MVNRRHLMPFGASIEDGGTRFRLWAPACDYVELVIEGIAESLPMTKAGDGWHERHVGGAGVGTRYRFRLPDGLMVPDPASRYQPEDVHGPSEVVDAAAFRWTDAEWHGRPWSETVLYELHVGTFTPEGTFRAAIDRLDHLVGLGITTIELLPLADFPGEWNWGYDGVLLYAPDASYGAPDDLRALVDAAHARGLSVMLDVVYNHYGPDGNYLGACAPAFFTDRHQTPWGAAINFDGKHAAVVRDFVIQNALYWAEEFHIDGFRLDAVHAIVDDSPTHLLEEFAARLHGLDCGRPIHLVMENEHNEARRLVREPPAPERFEAQWNDDVHHVLHTALTGEHEGYYNDYAGKTALLGRALAEGFAYQGEVMPYRGTARGEPSRHLPPTAFVAFLQNHDQIGNRAYGDRLAATVPPAALRAAQAVLLLLPQIPMIFMGEEWGAQNPFQFFCDFSGDLADAVRKGRREEFKRFAAFKEDGSREAIPDPLAPETFERSKLDWTALQRPAHAETLDWYRRILRVRTKQMRFFTSRLCWGGEVTEVGPMAVSIRWKTPGDTWLDLHANLKNAPQSGFPSYHGEVMWTEGTISEGDFGPWSVCWAALGK